MATTQTIRRGTKRVDRILAGAWNVRAYTLDNGFCGEIIPADDAPTTLYRYMERLRSSRLTLSGDHYTLHVHSNCWFKFSSRGR